MEIAKLVPSTDSLYKEDTMRPIQFTLATLCVVLMTSVAYAKDDKAAHT